MAKNKIPNWQPTSPANEPECDISGLPDREKCYPKSENPLLDYRKQRAKPCDEVSDPCELSTYNMVYPDASLRTEPINETWVLVENDEVTLTCDEIYGNSPIWGSENEDHEYVYNYGVPSSITVPKGSITKYVLDPLYPDGTREKSQYEEHVQSVREDLTAQALQRAISEITCTIQNIETSLNCPDIGNRPPVSSEAITIPQGQFTLDIAVDSNVPKTKEAYFEAANLPQLKSQIMQSTYQSLISQLGCTYGNKTTTAYCKYSTVLMSNKTWVLNLTQRGTAIDYDILRSVSVYASDEMVSDGETAKLITRLSLSEFANSTKWNKVAFDLKYITDNFDFENQEFDWNSTIEDVVPTYNLYRRRNDGTIEYKTVEILPVSTGGWGLEDNDILKTEQDFNTVKGNTTDYADPVSINGFPYITSDYPYTSVVSLSSVSSDDKDSYALDTEEEAILFLSEVGSVAAGNADALALDAANTSLICQYTNNEMVLRCPPGKIMLTGGDSITIPPMIAFRDNLYEANSYALNLYKSQLGMCSSGNIHILSFCDKKTLREYLDANKLSLGKYDIKSQSELVEQYSDDDGLTYQYPKRESEKAVETLLIYKNDFCDGYDCCAGFFPDKTSENYNTCTGKASAVTEDNCRAVEYASITFYEVLQNQFQSTTKSIVENNSDAIKLAIASVSCMYGNLPTYAYECNWDGGMEYGVIIEPACIPQNPDQPVVTCTGSGANAECVVGTAATAVPKDYYLSDDPCEASNMAARITVATRTCLGCDKVGTPGGHSNQVDVSTTGTTCQNCGTTCCWAL